MNERTHNMRMKRMAPGLGLLASIALAWPATAGPPIGDDFNDGDYQGWSDPLPYTFSGTPPTKLEAEIAHGELVLSGMADGISGSITAFNNADGNPAYANGQASFDAHLNPDVDAIFAVRADARTLTGYGFGVAESPDGTSGNIFISATIDNTVVEQNNLEVDFDVSDVRVDVSWIDDQLSITVSQLNGTGTATLKMTNSMISDQHGIAFLAEGGTPPGPPAPFSVRYDNLTVTPMGWNLLDDFTGDLDAWTPYDLTDGLNAQFETVDGRAVLSTDAVAGNFDSIALVHDQSETEPMNYTNGQLRTIINANDTNAQIFMRGDIDTLTGYGAVFRPTNGSFFVGRLDGGAGQILDEITTSYGNDEDLYIQLTCVGNELSGKIWPVNEPEPETPQVTATDNTYQQGGIVFAVDGPGIIEDPAPLYAEFGDAWFEPMATGDIDGDGSVGVSDLLQLLSAWGDCDKPGVCPEDLDGDGVVGVNDLLTLLSNWS